MIEYNPAPDLATALTPPKKQHFPFLTAEELPYFLKDLAGYTGSVITKIATKIYSANGCSDTRAPLCLLAGH